MELVNSMSNQMNDNHQKKNVIQFPKLKERLIEKGLESLKSKKFKEALTLLGQAEGLTDERDEIELGIVLCLLELGDLDEAKARCKRMLQQDIGDYFNVLQVYLTILIQLRQYKEVKETIEAVIEEDQIPSNYIESFYKLLDLSIKMTSDNEGDNYEILDNSNEDSLQERIEDILIRKNNYHEQAALVQSIKDYNLHKHLEVLSTFLQDENKHPIVKTIILQLLKEQHVQAELKIEKFGEVKIVIPSQLSDLLDEDYTKAVLDQLEDHLGNENPSLFEVTKELWLRLLFCLYPFTPKDDNPSIWAAALHLYGNELHGIEIENSVLEETYGVSLFELKHIIDTIQKIEEISYM